MDLAMNLLGHMSMLLVSLLFLKIYFRLKAKEGTWYLNLKYLWCFRSFSCAKVNYIEVFLLEKLFAQRKEVFFDFRNGIQFSAYLAISLNGI